MPKEVIMPQISSHYEEKAATIISEAKCSLTYFSRPAKPLMTVNLTIPSQPCNEDLISLNGENLSFLS